MAYRGSGDYHFPHAPTPLYGLARKMLPLRYDIDG